MSGGTSSLLDGHKIGNGCNLTARSKTDARKRRCAPLLAPFNASVRHHKMAQQVADTDFSIRGFLLSEVLRFVKYAATCPGVRRVAVVGSLATDKHDPKDADVLVIVDDDADLTPLAAAGRRLKGRAQSRNKGADIFLADPSGNYIGRTCHWRECRPGIRASCDARHCGRRAFLHDDLDDVTLGRALTTAPPLELWPSIVRRVELPEDVELQLVRPIEAHRAQIGTRGA